MTPAEWLDANNRYLGASLEWLRLRLLHLVPEAPPPAPGDGVRQAPANSGVLRRWMGARSVPPSAPPLALEDKRPTIEVQLARAADARAASAEMDPPPALILLAQRLGLSTFERDTLLLCAAMELDPGVALLCARARDGATRSQPTFGLALSLLDDPAWDALSAQRPLRYARLLEISQPGALPLTASPLRADERIVEYLKGLNVLDDRVASLVHHVPNDHAGLSPSQHDVLETLMQRLHAAAAASSLPLVQLVGSDPGSKLALAQEACAALQRQLYRLSTEALPAQVGEIETLARLWQRESLLLPVALYIEADGVDATPAEAVWAPLRRFLAREVGVVFVSVREAPLRMHAATISVDVQRPNAAEQRDAWVDALAGRAEVPEIGAAAMRLAGQFDLSLRDIAAAAALASQVEENERPLLSRAWDACRELTRPRLDQLAPRIEAKATWNDLVLPDEPMAQLRQIAGHVRERHRVYGDWGFAAKMNRGLGISALFTGESGTGKTMAAEVIANDLSLHLYRIDLSAVVSKYIGETEKNLRTLFDAAEQGGAILFFDEADALFGKRSEVKDSHDRYANIEINYLLQRMEAFRGLAILATNIRTALDPAFLRRLRFIVSFQFPGVTERRRLWETALPPETPRAGLNFDRLARLNLSGGNIHSIALNAAFLAAQNGQTVTMPLLLAATRTELRKLNKPVNEAELR